VRTWGPRRSAECLPQPWLSAALPRCWAPCGNTSQHAIPSRPPHTPDQLAQLLVMMPGMRFRLIRWYSLR